jgi:uncharacterized protein with GYD domain
MRPNPLREEQMPRYLTVFKYSTDSYKGLLKDKAAAREAAVRKATESAGGKLEALYWAGSGDCTGIAISELPDAPTGAAFIALIGSTGALSNTQVTELITTSEFDRALGKSMGYRPPGG